MKRLIKKCYHDLDNRDFALIYMGGEFYSGEIHAECVQEYFNNHPIKFKSNIDRIEDRCDFKYEFEKNEELDNLQFACMNVVDDYIFIEIDTIKNITINELAQKIKENFPGSTVYEDTPDYEDDMSAYRKIANK